jgi:hypothetical protein
MDRDTFYYYIDLKISLALTMGWVNILNDDIEDLRKYLVRLNKHKLNECG